MKIASIGQGASLNVLEWKEWLYQLVSALVSGGAGAVASAGISPIVDSAHFNPSTWAYYKLIVMMFFGTGLLKMCVYLQAHPVPDVKVVTTVQTIEKQKDPPAIVTTTVETTETKTEPKS
jgi:hypothetical protein